MLLPKKVPAAIPINGSSIFAAVNTSTCSGLALRTNGDGIAQDNEIGPSNNKNLGIIATRRPDPNLKRPHQWEYTALVQRQVGSNTSVSVGYYGRKFSDLYTTVNALVPSSAYTPVAGSTRLVVRGSKKLLPLTLIRAHGTNTPAGPIIAKST